jgi:hypothetical protein
MSRISRKPVSGPGNVGAIVLAALALWCWPDPATAALCGSSPATTSSGNWCSNMCTSSTYCSNTCCGWVDDFLWGPITCGQSPYPCASSPGAVCGDGWCTGGEGCYDCPADCGLCPTGGDCTLSGCKMNWQTLPSGCGPFHPPWSFGMPFTAVGVGTVSPGLGSGAPEGSGYRVDIEVYSNLRFGLVVNDGGETGNFCDLVDVPYAYCAGHHTGFDGVGLRPGATACSVEVGLGDIDLGSLALYRILGPKQNDEGKWEWNKDEDSDDCEAWTHINSLLLNVEIEDVHWDGTVRSATCLMRWFEPDPGPSPEDWSLYGNFLAGDAAAKCLQGGSEGTWRWIAPQASQYFLVCSDAGGCSSPKHYKIRVYYGVACKWSCPGGGCIEYPNPFN